jgi:hypothetical protein
MSLSLRKPWLGWFPRPTVVINGRGHPAQWGTGTWQISSDESTTVRVLLFNRLWTYGTAEFVLAAEQPAALVYSAPWLPLPAGKLRVAA